MGYALSYFKLTPLCSCNISNATSFDRVIKHQKLGSAFLHTPFIHPVNESISDHMVFTTICNQVLSV